MPKCGQREIVEEEIKPVDMDDVGILEVLDHGYGDWIAARAEVGNSDDLDTRHCLARNKAPHPRRNEQAIQRHNPYRMAAISLRSGKVADHVLQTADTRTELPHNMNNAHGPR